MIKITRMIGMSLKNGMMGVTGMIGMTRIEWHAWVFGKNRDEWDD